MVILLVLHICASLIMVRGVPQPCVEAAALLLWASVFSEFHGFSVLHELDFWSQSGPVSTCLNIASWHFNKIWSVQR